MDVAELAGVAPLTVDRCRAGCAERSLAGLDVRISRHQVVHPTSSRNPHPVTDSSTYGLSTFRTPVQKRQPEHLAPTAEFAIRPACRDDRFPDPRLAGRSLGRAQQTWWLRTRSTRRRPAVHAPGSRPQRPPEAPIPTDQRSAREMMGVRMVPIDSTSTSTTSPGPSSRGGVKLIPTPPGVPVAMTSPARRVTVSVM